MNRPEINVTPLIDVLLVLLIIFMIVTPIKPSSLEAKAPAERKNVQPADSPPLMLVVTVENNGEVRLNTETLGAGRCSDSLNPKIEKTVFIKAPKAFDYGSVAKVVDSVKLSGASPVGLQIDDLD